MPQIVLSRIARLLATLFAVSFITFFMTSLLPGDVVDVILPPTAPRDPATVAAIRAELRLDDPMVFRYFGWLGDALQGDFGRSFVSQRPVLDEITARLPITIQLTFVAILFSLLAAVPAGVICAYRQGTWIDKSISGVVQFLLSIPAFVAGIFLIWFFGVKTNLLPATGWVRITDSVWGNFKTVILPASSLAFVQLAIFARLIRADMITTLQENYVLSARAKGLSDRYILMRHALRPSSLSLITVLGLNIGSLLGGTVVIEQLFALPGLGRRLLEGIFNRDLLVVQGIVLFVASAYVIINTLVDLVYVVVDPRIRRKGG